MFRAFFFACFLFQFALFPGTSQASPFTITELIEAFERTVFGMEYRIWTLRPYMVKKYATPVRFYVHNLANKNRAPVIHKFIREIDAKVTGLEAKVARTSAEANFQVFVVDRPQYSSIVRERVFKDKSARVPGRCLVRVISDETGIQHSSAVIVSDEGDFLFRRCMVEEMLQGLGPMNDDKSLVHSVFNDRSRHSRFTAFDQILLNMLYDPRVKPGMTSSELEKNIHLIARDAMLRVR